MTSGLGRVTHVSQERQDEILAPDMTTEKLTHVMDRYVEQVIIIICTHILNASTLIFIFSQAPMRIVMFDKPNALLYQQQITIVDM